MPTSPRLGFPIRRLTLCAFLLAPSLAVPATATTPSFDCAQASGEVEELICNDEHLAALDHRLAEVYARAAATWPTDELPDLKAFQRGWIKGRNDCWKAEDVRECVDASYRTRIVELQIGSGQLEVPAPVGYLCAGDEGTPFFATFYSQTDPPSAVLTRGDDQVIAFIARSASGARYTAPGVELWEHQGEATVDLFGSKLKCKVR